MRRVLLWAACVVPLGGCAMLKEQHQEMQRTARARQFANQPLDPNIVQLVSFYSNSPFMSFDDAGDPNPEGVKVEAFYAVSGKTKKGAYGDGLIRFKMYVVHRPREQQPWGELVKTWEYTPEEAENWRVTRQVPHLGWPYQFHLNWGDLQLAGREIRIVPEFVRLDGQVIRGTPKDLKVPRQKFDVRYSDQISLQKPDASQPAEPPEAGKPQVAVPPVTEPLLEEPVLKGPVQPAAQIRHQEPETYGPPRLR